MSEFRKIEHAVASPTSCVGCGTHQGPFIDLGVAVPVYGALILCAETDTRSGCAGQIATMNGGLTRAGKMRMIEQLEDQDGERIKLQAELREAREKQFVRVEDLFRVTDPTSVNAGATITFQGGSE